MKVAHPMRKRLGQYMQCPGSHLALDTMSTSTRGIPSGTYQELTLYMYMDNITD